MLNFDALHDNLTPEQDFHNDSLARVSPTPAKAPISIFGLGYVGAVSAACFTELGHDVIGVDLDEEKVGQIKNGQSPIVEEGLPELLAQANKNEQLDATTDAEYAVLNTDVSFVSVCTPSNDDGSCNTDYLCNAAEQIGEALKLKDTYHLVLFRSTVPPGTTTDKLIPIMEHASGKKIGEDFGVCFNPEFLRESTAIEDFYAPPKTVIGASDAYSARVAANLYKDVEGEILQTSLKAAEFVKYVDNTWHALKVVFGNEIGRLCKASGVDSHEVMDIFCKDEKLNISSYYLKPGFAFGGSCLPKDVRGIQNLAEQKKVHLPVINNIIHSNHSHIEHVLEMIMHKRCTNIGFMGVTFKAGTDDLRESPVLKLIEQLDFMGYNVQIHDENLTEQAQKSAYGSSIIDKLPSLSTDNLEQMVDTSDLLIISHNTKDYQDVLNTLDNSKSVIDLIRLEQDYQSAKKYSGVCW